MSLVLGRPRHAQPSQLPRVAAIGVHRPVLQGFVVGAHTAREDDPFAVGHGERELVVVAEPAAVRGILRREPRRGTSEIGGHRHDLQVVPGCAGKSVRGEQHMRAVWRESIGSRVRWTAALSRS